VESLHEALRHQEAQKASCKIDRRLFVVCERIIQKNINGQEYTSCEKLFQVPLVLDLSVPE